MRRWLVMLLGAGAGVLVTGLCLLLASSLWSWLTGLSAASTPPQFSAATEALRPSAPPSPMPAVASRAPPPTIPEENFLRELTRPTPVSGQPGASSSSEPRWLPLTRLALQGPFEALGFSFQRTELGDGRVRWVAASPDGLALVEISGVEQAEQASVTTFSPSNPEAGEAAQLIIYMLTMLNAVLPGWSAGAEWFSEELVQSARQAGDYSAEIVHSGVRVQYTYDRQLGALTLSFQPE